jgi:hypothetical protein
MGKLLIVSGVILIVIGALFTLGGKIPWLGKLPGDIYIQKKNMTFFFPVTTSILISIALSLIALLFNRR